MPQPLTRLMRATSGMRRKPRMIRARCRRFDTCSVKSPLQRLNERVLRMLGDVTIAQICEEDFESLTAGLGSKDPKGNVRLPVIQNQSKDRT